jgi:hypothetical protein
VVVNVDEGRRPSVRSSVLKVGVWVYRVFGTHEEMLACNVRPSTLFIWRCSDLGLQLLIDCASDHGAWLRNPLTNFGNSLFNYKIIPLLIMD